MSSPEKPHSGGLLTLLRSIRFRLSLWFALVLAILLLAFGGFLYMRQAQDAQSRAADRLNERLRELDLAFRRALIQDPEAKVWPPLQVIPSESPMALEDDDLMLVTDPAGMLSDFIGPLEHDQAGAITAQAPLENTRKVFTASLVDAETGASTRYVFLSSPLGFNDRLLGWVILGQPLDAMNLLPRLAWTLAISSLALILAALLGGYWLADRALHPVKLITRTVQQIGETDLSRRLNIHSRDELGELAGTFDQMLDRLEEGFNRQRQFTADASHELRTPLTIIGLEAERALTSETTSAPVRQSLRVIHSENEFMTRLVGELLTLARMDSGQASLKFETVDLSEVVVDVFERFTPIAEEKGIEIRVGELPELPLSGDRHYLLQMVSNLVENAIKYSPAQSGQWVRIETGRQTEPPGIAWVRVSDNGSGIEPQHLEHIFDRFYRVDAARSHNPEAEEFDTEIPGSGLGLAIVQRIAQMHNGQVRVQSAVGQGTVFEVFLPAK